MASGGLMCEVSTVPKIGHKIESMEFLESLGKLKRFLGNQRVTFEPQNGRVSDEKREKRMPKLCCLLSVARARVLLHKPTMN